MKITELKNVTIRIVKWRWKREKNEYRGTEVRNFAEKHLRKIDVNSDTRETIFIHEETGEIWIMDYPDSGHHGGGIPRLRKLKVPQD